MAGHLKLAKTLEGHKDRVWGVSWSPDGQTLATCSTDKSIRLWKPQKVSGDTEFSDFAQTALIPDAHSRTVRSVSWSPCGKFIASASFDGTVNIWEVKVDDLEPLATLEGHENEVKSVAWSASGKYIATCSRDKTVWVWESVDDDGSPEFSCAAVINSHSQASTKKI